MERGDKIHDQGIAKSTREIEASEYGWGFNEWTHRRTSMVEGLGIGCSKRVV
jgi:hypothetical protein